MSILAYECAKEKKRLVVVSNRFDHLEEICGLFGFVGVGVVRRFDGVEGVGVEGQGVKGEGKGELGERGKKEGKVESATVKKGAV